jgi:hypothetical protein
VNRLAVLALGCSGQLASSELALEDEVILLVLELGRQAEH